MNPTFNPFKKPFGEIKEEDLECLKEVSEGWYVEYKQDKADAKKISKSIASFANSHGGLLFLGIKQDKENNVCEEVVGVEAKLEYIRDSVRGHVQPFPFFETYKIELFNGKHVLMVVIPEGTDPPYIHSSGKIYKRLDSGSDPINEKDRFAVDELYKKAQRHQEEIQKFRETEFAFCEGEENQPFLEIFANIYPFQSFSIKDRTFFENSDFSKFLDIFNENYEIRDVQLENFSISGNLNLDAISCYDQQIVLSNIQGCNLALNPLTIEIDTFGNLRALCPIPFGRHENKDLYGDYLQAVNELNVQNFNLVKMLGGRELFSIVCGLIYKYMDFLCRKGFKDTIEIKFKLKNCWRTSIYFDSEIYLKHIRSFGLPICRKNEQTFPDYPGIIIVDDALKSPIIEICRLFSMVTQALGLPHPVGFQSLLQEGSALQDP